MVTSNSKLKPLKLGTFLVIRKGEGKMVSHSKSLKLKRRLQQVLHNGSIGLLIRILYRFLDF